MLIPSKLNKYFTGGRVAVVGSDHEVGAQAVEVAAVLRIVDVVLEKHFFHPKIKRTNNSTYVHNTNVPYNYIYRSNKTLFIKISR